MAAQATLDLGIGDPATVLSIGERIRTIRDRRGLRRNTLAEQIGISVRQLARYEHDEIPPPADVLRRLALELDVSGDYLLALTLSDTVVDSRAFPKVENLTAA